MRKKIKLTTNKGKLYDWWLNKRLNFKLWLNHIDDDEEAATTFIAQELSKRNKL